MGFSFGNCPTVEWLALIPLLAVLLMLTLAVSLFFSATVTLCDTRYGVPSCCQTLLYLSPVAYPLETLGNRDQLAGDHPSGCWRSTSS